MKAIWAKDGVIDIHCTWQELSTLLGASRGGHYPLNLADRIYHLTRDVDLTVMVREHMARGGTPRLCPSAAR